PKVGAMRECHRAEDLLNDDLVGAYQAQNFTRTLVQQVEIQVLIRKPMRQVLHLADLFLQALALDHQFFGLRLDLDAAKNAGGALHRGEGEIKTKHENQYEKDTAADRQTLGHVELLVCFAGIMPQTGGQGNPPQTHVWVWNIFSIRAASSVRPQGGLLTNMPDPIME